MMWRVLVGHSACLTSTSDEQTGKFDTVNEPQALGDLVNAAKVARGGASGRELERQARNHGYRVVHTTLNALAAGTYKSRPSTDTIRAIAWLAGVSEEVAFAAAGVPMPGPPFADELPPGVDLLTPRSRRAAIEILRALVEAETKGGEERGSSAPKNPAGHDPAPGDASVSQIYGINPESLLPDEQNEDLDDPPAPPVHLAAARDVGKPSAGEQLRAQQDHDAEAGDDSQGEP